MKTEIREYLVCKYGAAFLTVTYFKLNLLYIILFVFCTALKFSNRNIINCYKNYLKIHSWDSSKFHYMYFVQTKCISKDLIRVVLRHISLVQSKEKMLNGINQVRIIQCQILQKERTKSCCSKTKTRNWTLGFKIIELLGSYLCENSTQQKVAANLLVCLLICNTEQVSWEAQQLWQCIASNVIGQARDQ